jgi:hypothetical protein
LFSKRIGLQDSELLRMGPSELHITGTHHQQLPASTLLLLLLQESRPHTLLVVLVHDVCMVVERPRVESCARVERQHAH